MSSKKHVIIILVITTFFIFNTNGFALSHCSYEPTGTLSGYVTDTLMNPLAGALVRVSFHGTYEENFSNSLGYYHVTNIPLCWCLKNVTCSKPGYQTESVLLSIDENTTYDFILAPLSQNPYPVFNGTMGNNGWYISCVNVTFVNIENIDALFYKVNAGQWTEYAGPFMICESGTHCLEWYWTYQGNQSAVCSVTLKIDRAPPILQLSSQRISLNKIKITAAAADALSDIDRVDFFVDDEFTYTAYVLPYETVISGLGTHHVEAVAFDCAGNSANSTIIISCSSQGYFPHQTSLLSRLFLFCRFKFQL